EDRGDLLQQPGLVRPGHDLELALVEPGTVAVEAAVDIDLAEADGAQLHAALRAAHPVQDLERVALGLGHLARLLEGELVLLGRFLAREVFLFGLARFVEGHPILTWSMRAVGRLGLAALLGGRRRWRRRLGRLLRDD